MHVKIADKEGPLDNDIKRENMTKFQEWIAAEHKHEEDVAIAEFFDELILKDDIDTKMLFGGKLEILRYIIKGEDAFCSELNSFWQNTGVIAALIGAIGVSVLLNPLGTTEAFVGIAGAVSMQQQRVLLQAYYACGAFSACSSLIVVSIVMVAYLHFTLMMSPADKLWFICTWDNEINLLPQLLILMGSVSLFGCLALGAFVVGNYETGIIVVVVTVFFLVAFLYIWQKMVVMNFQRAENTILRYRRVYKEMCGDNGVSVVSTDNMILPSSGTASNVKCCW